MLQAKHANDAGSPDSLSPMGDPAPLGRLLAVPLLALALLLSAPVAQAAPATTATPAPEEAGWHLPGVDWLHVLVQRLWGASGAETDDGAGMDPFGISQTPEEPTATTTPDDPDGEDGAGMDPFG